MSLTLIRDVLLGHGIKPYYSDANRLKYQVSIHGDNVKVNIEPYADWPGWLGCYLVNKNGTTWFSDKPSSMADRLLNYYCIKSNIPRSKL